jgi:ABC-2 type transport system permease protein
MHNVIRIFRKEFNSFFASPAAWLFLGGFLVVNLFIFFWVETFFARNIADLKPLFQWMPVLLIFLVAALTMRSWSEERRSGTLESLLTSPVSPLQLVLGKFIASLALIALALALTFPLPITVSVLGSLDWGPVFGGYFASLFLAGAYIAIGLYMSARTDNPIVALILTVAVAGVFYLLGSNTLTTLFGHSIGGFLELLGSGSRFDSITRGVFDIRDIYYYLSIMGIFLSLNLLSLEHFRWAGNTNQPNHQQWRWLTGLLIINFVLANFWLNSVGWMRVDLTQGKIYSLSASTKNYMQQLQEPLLIRGYFSAKSHPLLEPLVPQIKDLLEEYQVAGGDHVRVEFIDPHSDQALEEEAAEKYGIRPVPFRMASRYQSGVVNSYFDLVIAYGDQYETLNFEDLIEIKAQGEGEPEVLLKNPEYAITRAMHKIANAYQAGGNVFANLQQPLTFAAYISEDSKLPKALVELKKELKATLDDLKQSAKDKLNIEFADPDANGGTLAKQLRKDYGFAPQIASLFDPKPFWFYMVLKGKGENIQVPLPEELNKAELKKSIQATVQRMAPGYLKTVALVTPPAPAMNPMMMQMGMPPRGGKQYDELRQALAENVRVIDTDLKNGHVPADADLLLLLASENLDDKQLFAVDQFLMQGGSVVVATSPYDIDLSRGQLNAKSHHSGLEKWLEHHGLSIAESMVLDPKNAALPIPVRRNLGPISVREIKMVSYPYFPDIRSDGLNKDNPMTASLGQLTLNWASPIDIDTEKNKQREVIQLLHSSADSWTTDQLNILPDYQRYPDVGFKPEEKRSAELLAVAVKGQFESFFKGKETPLLEKKEVSETSTKDSKEENSGKEEKTAKNKEEEKTVVSSIIERSSDSARIILIASNTFASDSVLNLASQGQGTRYSRPLEFMQNSIDWSLDNQGLMAIRGRAQFARILEPMQQGTRLFWEYLNYLLALAGLFAIWFWRRKQNQSKQTLYQKILAEV